MGKKEVVSDIELMEEMDKKRRKKEEADNKLPRPSLIKRIGIACLDLLMVFIVFVGSEVLLYHTLFKALHYNEMLDEVQEMYDNSHLFEKTTTSRNESIYNCYDKNKSPEENYEIRITYYYENDERAINANRMEVFEKDKLNSNLYELQGETIVRKENATDDEIRAFLEKQYKIAETFFKNSDRYIEIINSTARIMSCSYLISITIASAIFYLFIPMLRKEGETLGQMIGKLCIVDSRDNSQVKKWQIFVRYVALYIINFFFPVCMYVLFGSFSLIPTFISLVIMCFTKTNSGPHEYVSYTYVILKSRTDNFQTLKQLRGDK